MGPQTLGIIEGVVEAIGSLLRLFSGVYSDKRQSNKIWVVAGYSLSSIIKPLLFFAFVWPLVLLIRFADKIGKALRTAPRDALLASSVSSESRGLAFGLHRAMDNAGAVIGPLVATGLLSLGMSIKDIFLWTIVPGIFCIGLTLAIKEPAKISITKEVSISWHFSKLPQRLKRYLIILGIFSLGNSSNMFLLLRAKDMGLTPSLIPLLWGLTALTATVFSVPLSALSDRWGRKTLILMGWLIYGIFYLILGFNANNLTLLWFLFAFYGLFLAATEGAEKAFIADLAEKPALGTAYGWFSMITGLMLLPASLFFGILWQHLAPAFAFGFSGGLALIAALLFMIWL